MFRMFSNPDSRWDAMVGGRFLVGRRCLEAASNTS